ncbi:DUF924 family protein [Chiayiivirga flava]|uniref:Uncharacterized protein (DUF924 family) n=1 Tax=Chiayiivirga flava TaxID=659595 RepID=A0A7W8FZM9_9GAMM|nr:DUF924 family protein [Chiayiivirga flava]MBB5207369.1 uncharacterized protein (DUF924 family) [Chiayiivirga flava]
MNTQRNIEAVIGFWRDAGPQRWFAQDDAFDTRFRERFLDAHHAAARRERDAWADTPDGVLALLILLDQFPRNAFRGTAHMFATDGLALHFTERALAAGFDARIEAALRPFVYMPLMHSEAVSDQDRCVACMQPIGGESLKYAEVHRDIIRRFGRFPHRNPMLGRETTSAERAFLDAGGFAG